MKTMTQVASRTHQRGSAATDPSTRDRRAASQPPSSRLRPRWRALPVIALTALMMGGLVVTSEFVLGGAASPNPHAGKKVVASPAPTASRTPRPPSEPVPVGAFATRVYRDASGNSMTYYLYGPAGYTPTAHYPLVMVLHGGGERADPALSAAQNRDVVLRQAYIQPFVQAFTQTRWPCFVVVPQASVNQRWVNVPASLTSYTLAAQPSLALTLAMAIVQHLQQEYAAIDANRLYVGGISMGGYGTWEALERWPTTFAAGFPIAGAGDPHAAGRVQASIWAFHGSGDSLAPVEGSRLMVQAAQAAGGTTCYTEYPGAAHDIWATQPLLNDPKVLEWLFSQRRMADGSVTGLDCQGRVPRRQ